MNKQAVLILVATCSSIFSAELQAQATRMRPDLIWIEPNTPINEALDRGILFSPLESAFTLTNFGPQLHRLPRLPSAVALSNGGTSQQGKNVFGVSANLNDPLGIGDRLELKGAGTDESGNDIFSLGYSVPLGSAGTRIAAYYSRIRYQLGEDVAALMANGEVSSASLRGWHPIAQTRDSVLYVVGGYQRSETRDRIDAIGSITDSDVTQWNLGLSGDLRDRLLGGGLSFLGVNVELGELELAPPGAVAADQGPGGHRTLGSFQIVSYQARRLQRVTNDVSLFFRFEGQMASKNLRNGGIGIGGPDKVRAYGNTEAGGDEGYFVSAEGRYLVPGFDFFGTRTALIAFYDRGHVKFNKNPLPTDVPNERTLAGYGFGLFLGKQANFSIRASLAWRTEGGNPQGSDGDRSPRTWIQLAKWF